MKNTIFLLLSVIACYGGWERVYGGSEYEGASSIVTLDDGCFVVAGNTQSYGAGSKDVYIIKADSLGDILWTKTYGGTAHDYATFMSKTPEGGFIIAGYTGSFGVLGESVYLLKTDENGDTLWTKTLTGSEGTCVKPTSDNGFIITANLFGEGLVIKTDSLGNRIWEFLYSFGGWPSCELNAVVETDDGEYLACGSSESPVGIPEKDEDDSTGLVLLKLSHEGDTLWSRYYFHYNEIRAISLIPTNDSCFAFIGVHSNYSPHYGWYSSFCTKTDPSGDIIWSRSIDVLYENTFVSDILHTEDGGFSIVGLTEYSTPYFMKLNSSGDSLWLRTYETISNMKSPSSVSETSDGGFLIAGTGRIGSGDYNIYVLKVDSLGYTNIAEMQSTTPNSFALSAHPNPFNSAVKIAIEFSPPYEGGDVRRTEGVTVEIFDLSGRCVAQLPSPSVPLPEGEGGDSFSHWEKVAEGRMRAFTWQPAESLPSGVYLVRATIDSRSLSGGPRAESRGDEATATTAPAVKRVVYLK